MWLETSLGASRHRHIESRYLRQISPFRARHFLLRAQEKVLKEKGTRCPRRLMPVPCVPLQAGGAHNSEPVRDFNPAPACLGQGARLHPGLPALLGAGNGTGSGSVKSRQAPPSIAAGLGLSEPPCRAGFASRKARQILRVRRAPKPARSAGNPKCHRR
jgi:hypothetical protein